MKRFLEICKKTTVDYFEGFIKGFKCSIIFTLLFIPIFSLIEYFLEKKEVM